LQLATVIGETAIYPSMSQSGDADPKQATGIGEIALGLSKRFVCEATMMMIAKG